MSHPDSYYPPYLTRSPIPATAEEIADVENMLASASIEERAACRLCLEPSGFESWELIRELKIRAENLQFFQRLRITLSSQLERMVLKCSPETPTSNNPSSPASADADTTKSAQPSSNHSSDSESKPDTQSS